MTGDLPAWHRPGHTRAEVQALLERSSDENLLTTFAALTHRMHEGEHQRFRTQRDQVKAEILRRMK